MPLSVVDKLLLAAYDLSLKGKAPFSAEDLVVSAWMLYPRTFGLAGYNGDSGNPRYPDSNRVYAEVMGSKPIRKRGLVRKVGTKKYEITEAGLESARLLSARKSEPQTEKATLARETGDALKHLLSSRARAKFLAGRQGDVTFSDACAFWGISPRSTAIQLQGRLANLRHLLESAQQATGREGASFTHGGDSFSAQDLSQLAEIDLFMRDRFRVELQHIAARVHERQ